MFSETAPRADGRSQIVEKIVNGIQAQNRMRTDSLEGVLFCFVGDGVWVAGWVVGFGGWGGGGELGLSSNPRGSWGLVQQTS